jgi:hypothetical protein
MRTVSNQAVGKLCCTTPGNPVAEGPNVESVARRIAVSAIPTSPTHIDGINIIFSPLGEFSTDKDHPGARTFTRIAFSKTLLLKTHRWNRNGRRIKSRVPCCHRDTLKTYCRRMVDKLQLDGLPALIRFADEAGLVRLGKRPGPDLARVK